MKQIQTPPQNVALPVIQSGANVKSQPRVALTTPVDTVTLSPALSPEEAALHRTFGLLKSSIMEQPLDKEIFKNMDRNDWVRILNYSQKNGLSGLVCDTLRENKDLDVPEDVSEIFEKAHTYAEKNHARQERVLRDFSSMTAKEGIDTVQMKGIGLSMNYPKPTSRFGGDIDCYNLKKGADSMDRSSNMSFYVDKLAEKNGMLVDADHGVKHSVITHRGMPIENHRNFLNVESYKLAGKMNDFLLKNLNPREQILPRGTKILVPSPEFNTVFLSFHAMQHYLGGDANVHHLADWAMHVKKNGLKIPKEVKGTPLEKFIYAMTNITNKHLGTNVKVPKTDDLEKMLMSQYVCPYRDRQPKVDNCIGIFKMKFDNIVERQKSAKALLGEGSLAKGLWASFKNHRTLKSYIDIFRKVR